MPSRIRVVSVRWSWLRSRLLKSGGESAGGRSRDRAARRGPVRRGGEVEVSEGWALDGKHGSGPCAHRGGLAPPRRLGLAGEDAAARLAVVLDGVAVPALDELDDAPAVEVHQPQVAAEVLA